MDPTTEFFSKLRKLAMTLESETMRLQLVFENRSEDSDGETTARAMRAYHELNCEVGSLKEEIQDQLAEQKKQENKVSNFIKACRVVEQRVSKDIQAVRTHLETYGYRAPCDSQKPSKTKDQEAEAEKDLTEENESRSAADPDESQGEDDGIHCSSPPKMEQHYTDVMRTPQLSDFGLSEIQLKRALGGVEWCSEVPPIPEINLPLPSLNTPASPPFPITPKCALRMDDDELQTPQMHEFGITEHTMCLNNDFTMDLFRKNAEKTQRPPQDIAVPTVNPEIKSVQTTADKLESPEMPVFFTPGFKIKKSNGQCSPPKQDKSYPASPCHPENLPSTPEVPAFQTPYLNRLVSTKKSAQPEPIITQTDDDINTFELQTSCNGSKHIWDYKMPEISVFGVEDKQMPEMPKLESFLGNSLQIRNGKMLKINENKDTAINSLEQDGVTQEFNLGTPCFRANYQEPCTPEMPDLSSVTQDICKLLSQAQMKKTTTAPVHSFVEPEISRHGSVPQAKSVSVVSQSEFQTLPNYLRRMTLSSLNQAISNINTFMEKCHGEFSGETKGFTVEELRRITGVGTMAPVYILCLKELKRLKQVEGVLGADVYNLITHD